MTGICPQNQYFFGFFHDTFVCCPTGTVPGAGTGVWVGFRGVCQ